MGVPRRSHEIRRRLVGRRSGDVMEPRWISRVGCKILCGRLNPAEESSNVWSAKLARQSRGPADKSRQRIIESAGWVRAKTVISGTGISENLDKVFDENAKGSEPVSEILRRVAPPIHSVSHKSRVTRAAILSEMQDSLAAAFVRRSRRWACSRVLSGARPPR
jgi:hypothetical protein